MLNVMAALPEENQPDEWRRPSEHRKTAAVSALSSKARIVVLPSLADGVRAPAPSRTITDGVCTNVPAHAECVLAVCLQYAERLSHNQPPLEPGAVTGRPAPGPFVVQSR